ncbi:DUF6517 family protein [Halorussus gelatinilyticus]|uniref:DUF6517 family protein n=1 Tax=Halorussus gelatinilyticus TaxID=2937524 RepID=A0A8U0IGL8_9EURY|nr:DUF6517 family protein [Halorussus gelatinilyticus]UPV99874.1 DUF6517 family protein [Halorussus gelatinilyticus]
MTRRAVAGVSLAVLLVLGGCTGFLSGPVSFTASQATVSDAALEETGYQHNSTTAMNVSRTFSAAGQSKEVEVTNWISEYHQRVGLPGVGQQKVAVFATFSSPQVDILGKSFNPLDKYSDRQLAQRFTSQLDSVSGVREVGSQNRTMLGKTTEVSKFEASVTTAAGVQFDAYLYVTKVKHEGDFVVAVGVHPQKLPGQEQKIYRLLRGVEHAA